MGAWTPVLVVVGINVLATTAANAGSRAALKAAKLDEPNPLIVALFATGAVLALTAAAKHFGDES